MAHRCVRLLPALFVVLVSAVAAGQPPDPTAVGPTAVGPQGQPSDRGVMSRPRAPQMPPRDAPPSNAPATASVRGRVTDTHGRALHRASVSLFGRQSRQPRSALTDADGRFEIGNLVAGQYQAMATKGGYVRLSLGQRSAHGVGRPLVLAVGQALDKIDFVLPRGGVIAGRVVDELGDPVAEANVMTLRYATMDGRRRLMPGGGRHVQTDDLGQFRLYGLAPGDYYVSAQVHSGGFGPPGIDPGRGDGSGYAPTFAPGTTNVAEATRFTVQPGQELSTEIQLTASHLHRVSGTVVSSTGRPAAGGFVTLAPKGELTVGAFGSGGQIGEDGAFAIDQVVPGSYMLTVRTGAGGFFGPSRRDRSEDAELALVPVTVGGEDLTGLRVVTDKGLTVPGVLIAEGGTLPTDPPLQIMAFPTEPGAAGPGRRPRPTQPDGRFQLEGVLGEMRVSITNLPRGWMVKSMIYKDADVSDKPVEFTADGGTLRIVITDRVTILTGTVSQHDAVPLTDYAILVFSADPERWLNSSRTMRVVRPNEQGVYRIEALPSGEYHVAAFDVDAFEALDEEIRASKEFLERVRSVAQRAEITQGDTRTLTLKLSALPQ